MIVRTEPEIHKVKAQAQALVLTCLAEIETTTEPDRLLQLIEVRDRSVAIIETIQWLMGPEESDPVTVARFIGGHEEI